MFGVSVREVRGRGGRGAGGDDGVSEGYCRGRRLTTVSIVDRVEQ